MRLTRTLRLRQRRTPEAVALSTRFESLDLQPQTMVALEQTIKKRSSKNQTKHSGLSARPVNQNSPKQQQARLTSLLRSRLRRILCSQRS